MGQKGFFDVERRLEAISAKGDPLETIKKIVPWEDFRADIEAVTRARVEHVFGHQQSAMGGKIVRTIGIARARFKIGMMNLGYNIRRLVQLERMAAAPA